MLKRFLALALSVAVFPAGAADGGAIPEVPRDDREGVRLLFIGNSLTYSNDMPEMLRWMLVESGVAVGRIEIIAFPNVGLQDHWDGGPARSRIAEGGWDVVVMQQGPSATEGRPSLFEYAQRFGGVIREAQATPALFMVWPAAPRIFDFNGVSESYVMAAERADGLLFPVGEAWRAAWRARPELELYGPDGFHPSALGSYLAALVIFDQLTDVDLSSLPAVVPTKSGDVSIPHDVADSLHRAAVEANQSLARSTAATEAATPRLRVAMTFDDLPSHGPRRSGETLLDIHREILDTLERHGVTQAYGFVNGERAAREHGRESLELWLQRGHPLGNHTWSHPDIGEVGAAAFIAEIERNDAFLRELTGNSDAARAQRRMFRYPYLRQGRDAESVDAVRRFLSRGGYRIAEVSVDFYDWAYNPPYVRCSAAGRDDAVEAMRRNYLLSADAFLNWSSAAANELFGRDIAHILLLHIGSFDARMLDELLTRYEHRGVEWITLEEALADSAYARDIRLPAKYWGNWLHKVIQVDEAPHPPEPLEADGLLDPLCR